MERACLLQSLTVAVIFITTTTVIIPSTWAIPVVAGPRTCCPPDQYNGTLVTTTIASLEDKDELLAERGAINMDFQNRRLSSRHGDGIHVITLPDKIYTINETAKECKVAEPVTPFPDKKCVATGFSRVPQRETANTTLWLYLFGYLDSSSVLVTKKDCLLIQTIDLDLPSRYSYITTSKYLSEARPVIDESEFTVPSYC